MRHYAALFLAVLGAGFWERGATQYSDVLYSDNGIPWRGDYGWYDECPDSSSSNASFTYALDFKYDDLDDLDYIGGDAVMLYCRDDVGYITGYVSSLQGSRGEWQGAGCWREAAAQDYWDVLYSDNGMSYRGQYGDMDLCPYSASLNETFAYALDFKYDDLDDLDFIGGDSVKLYCRDGDNIISGYVSSLEGKNGEWQGLRSCPVGEYFIGFRLRVYPEQGTWGDDFAVDNIQLACSDGTVVDGLDGVTPPSPYVDIKRGKDEDETEVVTKWVEIMGTWVEMKRHRPGKEARLNGQWGTWIYCSPGRYVNGIRTVVEEGHIDDDAGLTDVTIFCN